MYIQYPVISIQYIMLSLLAVFDALEQVQLMSTKLSKELGYIMHTKRLRDIGLLSLEEAKKRSLLSSNL